MGRKSGKGAKTRPRGDSENAYMPGDNTKRRNLRARIDKNKDKTEIDPRLSLALKHGVQRDKKRANYEKFREAKKDAKRARREQRAAIRKETGEAKAIPKTKENMRKPVLGMVDDAADLEIRRDEQTDEFSEFYAQTREKVPEYDEEVEEVEEGEDDDEDEKKHEKNKDAAQDDDDEDDDDMLLNEEELLAMSEMMNMEEDFDDDDEEDADVEEDFATEVKQVEIKNQKNKSNKKGGGGVAEVVAANKDEDSSGNNAEKKEPEKKMNNPKILLTTCQNPSYKTRLFVRECLWLFPNSAFRPRKNYTLTEIIQYCTDADFSFVICVGERIKEPFEMIITHLPEGPTATFRISNFLPAKEIENVGERTEHYPELNLKNFDTRLGRRMARILEALFPATRDYAGRAIATFHNQRDFIFVRTHRYMFDSMDEVRIQELGPRMTLRLMSLQKGTFDSKFGEFEWIRKKKHDTDKLEWFL